MFKSKTFCIKYSQAKRVTGKAGKRSWLGFVQHWNSAMMFITDEVWEEDQSKNKDEMMFA